MLPIKVHFKQDSMENSLSFNDISSVPGVRITMDTYIEDVITVKLRMGEEYRFKNCSKDLYYFDTDTFKVEDKHKIWLLSILFYKP